MKNSNYLILALSALLTAWWIYLVFTISNDFIAHKGYSPILFRGTPLTCAALLIGALILLIRNNRHGLLLLLIVWVIQLNFELLLGEKHLLMLLYLLAMAILVMRYGATFKNENVADTV